MDFLPFFLVLLASVLFSMAFRRFHLPWVLAMITAGIVLGPFGFSLIESTPTVTFISQIGLVLLMFMAGLEVKLSTFRQFRSDILILATLNAGIPFIMGYLVGFWFDFSTLSSLLLGVIFMSSSIAVIIPTMESTGLIDVKLGRSIVAATVLADIASLVILSVLLQTVDPVTELPLVSFYVLMAFVIVAFYYGLPKIRKLIPRHRNERDLFESEVRIIVALLIGVVVIFELLGLHPIIAGFFTGLVLSESITSEIIIEKLRTISYGIFIPIFFVVIGMQTDVSIFFSGLAAVSLVAAVLFGSVGAKFLSGWIGARLVGFSHRDALAVGSATIPQLSTSLAVVFTAVELDLVPSDLIAAMVVLSIITTMLAPFLLRYFGHVREQSS